MELHQILEQQCCRIGLGAKTKCDLLREMATLACRSSKLDESRIDEIASALEKRESQGSTGFGGGFAIPHARLPNMKDFVLAIGVHPEGVNFESLDRKKVHLFFLIIGPEEKVSEHLKILAAVSQTLTRSNVQKEILASRRNEAVYETFIRNAESLGTATAKKPKLKFFVLILFLEEYVYDILELYLQKGIEGAIIIDSFGMGEYISNVPLFATFTGFMQEKKNHSKTIMALIPADIEAEIIAGIETLLGDLDKKQGAMFFSMDVGHYKGSMKML